MCPSRYGFYWTLNLSAENGFHFCNRKAWGVKGLLVLVEGCSPVDEVCWIRLSSLSVLPGPCNIITYPVHRSWAGLEMKATALEGWVFYPYTDARGL